MPADRPIATVATVQARPVLTAVDTRAAALGLSPGLALADARARLPELTVLPADPAADARALDQFAASMERYTPTVGLDGADGLWLDVAGADHLQGGEAELLNDLLARTRRAGYAARAALADTPGAAWALARYGTPPDNRAPPSSSHLAAALADAARPPEASPQPVLSPPVICPPGGQRTLLAPLPIAALRLDAVTVETLGRLGLRRVGDLIDQPRGPLVQRFGPTLTDRLDQALGRTDEPIQPRRPPPPFQERLQPVEPLTRTGDVARALHLLLTRLADRLARARRGARRLELVCYRVDGAVRRLAIGTSRPARDPARLARLFERTLDTLDPGFGIELVALAANEVEPLDPFQLDLGPGAIADRLGSSPDAARDDSPRSDAAADLIDRLSERLGAANVRRLVPQASHLPERATRSHPATRHRPARGSTLRSLAGRPTGRSAGHEGGRALPPPVVWRRGRWRPPRLLARPEPIEALALLPDRPPARFRWRGQLWRVAHAEGPERIAPEWWPGSADQGELWPKDATASSRDAAPLDASAFDGSPARSTEDDHEAESGTLARHAPVADAATRDYYRVETIEGRRFWLFRRGLAETRPHGAAATPPVWYLHAIAP